MSSLCFLVPCSAPLFRYAVQEDAVPSHEAMHAVFVFIGY